MTTAHERSTAAETRCLEAVSRTQATSLKVGSVAKAVVQLSESTSSLASQVQQYPDELIFCAATLGANRLFALFYPHRRQKHPSIQLDFAVSNAVQVSRSARYDIHAAERTVSSLVQQSHEISEVVNLIHAIADQNRMLVLNATIEAA